TADRPLDMRVLIEAAALQFGAAAFFWRIGAPDLGAAVRGGARAGDALGPAGAVLDRVVLGLGQGEDVIWGVCVRQGFAMHRVKLPLPQAGLVMKVMAAE